MGATERCFRSSFRLSACRSSSPGGAYRGGAHMRSDPVRGEAGPDSILMEVSREMVLLYKEQFGRGPTKARTHWAGPDAMATFLEDTLTAAERNLAKMGEHERLRDMRMYFQYATIERFCEAVERITGRKIRSFQSSIDTKVEGMSIEIFVFYAEGEDGPSRIELGVG